MNTHMSSSRDEEGSCHEGDVVATIEAMPEGTEDKHCQCAVDAFIHNITQPVRCTDVPVV